MDQVPIQILDVFTLQWIRGLTAKRKGSVSWKGPLMITMMLLITVVMPLQLPLMSKLQYIYYQFDCNMRKITPETDGQQDERIQTMNGPKRQTEIIKLYRIFYFLPYIHASLPQYELSVWTSRYTFGQKTRNNKPPSCWVADKIPQPESQP